MRLIVVRPISSAFYSTAYLFASDKQAVVVDAGLPGAHSAILASLASLGLASRALTHILVTHAHADHTGGLADLAQVTGATIVASRAEAAEIERGGTGAVPTVNPGVTAGIAYQLAAASLPGAVRPARVRAIVAGGDRIDVLGGIDVVALPGHTLGHVGFGFRANGDLAAGDALMTLFGEAVRVPWHANKAMESASIKAIIGSRHRRILTGHGTPIQMPLSNTARIL
jgi:glyoxylase-like metal-dependent hydrolase (beta-lactamase superfamily II)